ncbi:uncharacterized protein N7487_007493 [Penicillium crustosum]|uniref:uncharacterized protein n=1 Tax=Penicillium crustosum TaxID=36656 RepID=UPI0023A4DE42|nr:uncharacterized protein N7487_007493 [Penicillium crustosum]KAJ5401597.1 hypothetical protein N7487_007493 [Penicillium crustosum]
MTTFGQSTTFLLLTSGQALQPSLNSECEMIVSNLCDGASTGACISLAKEIGITIKWWAPPAGHDPCLSLETLKPLLTPETRIVTCNHVSNVVGTIYPIRKNAIGTGKVFGYHIAQLYGRRSVQKCMLTGISHFFLSEMPGHDWHLRLGSPAFELKDDLGAIKRYLGQIGWEKMIAQEIILQETLLSRLRQQPSVFRIFRENSSNPHKRVPVIAFQVIGESSREIINRINRQTKFRIVSGHCWAPRPTHDIYNTVEELWELCETLQQTLEFI